MLSQIDFNLETEFVFEGIAGDSVVTHSYPTASPRERIPA